MTQKPIPHYRPRTFRFSIEGFHSPNCKIKWQGGKLWHAQWANAPEPESQTAATPQDSDW